MTKPNKFPFSPEELRELLDYDPEAGKLTWKVQTSSRALAGEEAGSLESRGYRQIRIRGVRYPAHRLAWYYIYGVEPKEYLDHINGERDNNRLENLREATHAQNLRNRGKLPNNTSGFKGVHWDRRDKKFVAKCRVNGKRHHLGYHDTAEAAHEAYKAFATKEHGAFARTE